MYKFKVLDHPADIGIEVKGNSLEELFSGAILATTSLVAEPDNISSSTEKKIKAQGVSLEEAFINLLDEIIYLFDSSGFLIKEIKEIKIKNNTVDALVKGEKFNKSKQEIKLYLKAVTYHQLYIKQLEDKSWEAVVYFDV